MHTYTDSNVQRAARALAARMNAALSSIDSFEQWAPVVIETARGCGGAAWLFYDDAGGNAHRWVGDQFWKVRQVRNHPIHGRALCKAVNETQRGK